MMMYTMIMTIPSELSPLEKKLVHALASAMIVIDDAPRCRDTIRALVAGQAVLADIYGLHNRPWDIDFRFIRDITKEGV